VGKIGDIIYRQETVVSTQTIATQFAYEGMEEGCVVVAEEQTGGRGRMNRKWHATYGDALAMSMILRPNIAPKLCPPLTLLTAVAIVQAIKEVAEITVDIKWPNDILIQGKKLAGILTEMYSTSEKIHFIIIGIGINVYGKKENFTDEIKNIATSILMETGNRIQKETLMKCICEQMERLYQQFLRDGFAPIKQLWEKYATSIGKEIIARSYNQVLKGIALGITEEGILLLKDKQGVIHHVYSADIDE